MTGLTTDLAALTSRHGNEPADTLVTVPIGAIRAAVIALTRYDEFPLVDRLLHAEYVDNRTSPRRGGGKKQGYVDMVARRRDA
jgi:hypothetical protein